MTVLLMASTQNYLGLSSDTKPTSPAAGSTFYETDSGALYIYDGAAWQLKRDAAPFFAAKTLTFTGAADLGAVGNVPLFTVTGEVMIVLLSPWCSTLLGEAAPGGATLALGVTGNTTLLVPATTALDIDAGEFWLSTVPKANGGLLPATLQNVVITDNIVGTVATAAVNSGAIRFDLLWLPLSSNGLAAAA